MSEKRQTEVKNLKEGGYVMIDDEVYTVDSLQTSKPGKHGGAKAKLTVSGVFTPGKKTITKPANAKINVPVIEKKDAQVIALVDGIAQLMDMETYETYDLPIPEDLKGSISEGVEVVVWEFEAKKLIKGIK